MANELQGKRIAFLAADMFEQVELTEPWKAVEKAGGKPELLSLKPGKIRGFNHFDPADTFKVDRTVEEAHAEEYDALVVPGGVGNPDQLRADENAVRFVQEMHQAGKPMGVICHGPWVLVEAGIARGRRLTSYPSIETDVRNAGGTWVNEEVVVDEGIVTSRSPDDLPAFCRKIVEEFAEGVHERRHATEQAFSS
jgi:protease I